MIFNQFTTKDTLKLIYNGIVLLSLFIFFSAQPFHRATVISSSTALWLCGLLILPHYLKNKAFDKKEVVLYIIGGGTFFICLTSWLGSDYFNNQFKVIEPDARFLLFPLTVIAIRYSGLTLQHLAMALFFGSIAYIYITYTTPHGRVSGDENAVTFGNGAMLLAVVSSCLALMERNKFFTAVLIISAVGYFYASYSSGTRGSFVAIPPLFILFFYFTTKKIRILLTILLITGVIALGQTPMGSRIKTAGNNFINFLTKDEIQNSTGIRLHMWQAAYCLNQENPWLGKGPHQYKKAIQDENTACKVKLVSVQAHSFYFNALATIGFIGLAAMLTFFMYLVYYSWSLPLAAKITIPAAVLTILSYGITVDLFFHRYLADKHLTLLAVLLGLALNFRNNSRTAETTSLRHPTTC